MHVARSRRQQMVSRARVTSGSFPLRPCLPASGPRHARSPARPTRASRGRGRPASGVSRNGSLETRTESKSPPADDMALKAAQPASTLTLEHFRQALPSLKRRPYSDVQLGRFFARDRGFARERRKATPPRHSSPCGGRASLNQIVAVTLEFRFQGKNRSLARPPKA